VRRDGRAIKQCALDVPPAAELNSLRRGKPVLRSRARLHPLAMERRDPTITPYGDEHVAPG
jgi:hypothetical protein